MLEFVINIIFISSSSFSFLIINVKILSNFQNEWCILGRKKKHLKKNKNYPLLKFECFEHANNIFYLCQVLIMQTLQLIENIPTKLMTIQTIMFPLWSFKHIKMQFLKMSTHFGGSFDYDLTLGLKFITWNVGRMCRN